MSKTVVALFDNATEAQQAVEALVSNGFMRENIDVSGSTGHSTEYENNNRDTNESGISRFFRSLFGNDEDEANRYTKVAERSGSIVTAYLESPDEAERAAKILDDYGAVDVDEKAGKSDYTAGSNTGNENDSIQVIEENVEVGKREVETGGVRLRSRIIERPVEETLRLREERVNVERTPVDRTATDADLATFQEEEIEIVEHAEVPVVSKEARVVEEISLNKEVEEKTETINESVRKTEVEVEQLETKNGRNKKNTKKKK